MVTILKRFEIWLLFALVGGAIWWAMDAENEFEADESSVAGKVPVKPGIETSSSPEGEESENSLLEVRGVDLHPESDGMIVELTLMGRSGTGETVALDEKILEVLTSEGESIHRFYLPFDPAPLLPAEEKSLVTLRYWLSKPVDVLWLTYRDQTLRVDIEGEKAEPSA